MSMDEIFRNFQYDNIGNDTATVKVLGIRLEVEYQIDVDCIDLKEVSLPDSCGEDIVDLLAPKVVAEIKSQIIDKVRSEYRDNGCLSRCPV